MRKQLTIAALAALALAACSGDDTLALPGGGTGPATGPAVDPSQVQITVGVANDGAGFATRTIAADHRKKVYTSASIQKIDHVKFIICKPAPGTTITDQNMWGANTYDSITHVKTFTQWMTTGSTVAVNGREAAWKPAATDKPFYPKQDYLVYAIGHSTGGYTETDRFDAIAVGTVAENTQLGDVKYVMPATIDKSDLDNVSEIFAGSTKFTVGASGGISATVSLHRQVAGTIGYFTNIPAVGDEVVEADGTKHSDKTARYLRLVAGNASKGIRMAQFNDNTSSQKYIVNGVEAVGVYGMAQFYATQKAGTKFPAGIPGHNTTDPYTDAYELYKIDLNQWFPNGDQNGDNVLNHLDIDGDITNADGSTTHYTGGWINPLRPDSGTPVVVKKGSVVDGTFVFPFTPAQRDMNKQNATFELQLLDASNHIIKIWPVNLASDDPQVGAKAYEVQVDGTMAQCNDADTQARFCVVRNHLYTIGARGTVKYDPDDPNPGPGPNPDPDPNPDDKEDQPADLTQKDVRVYVSGQWEKVHQMGIGN